MMTRTLGRSGIKVSALGLGCRAFGDLVEEAESVRAIRRALDLGINFFDVADAYGGGRGERVLGQALRGARDEAVIATGWGHTFDEATGAVTGQDPSPAYLRRAVTASLRRLATDWIDLYLLRLETLPVEVAVALLDPLEDLVAEGKIRWYGWSTDQDDRAAVWGNDGPHCTAVRHDYSVRHRSTPDVLAICEALELASMVRDDNALRRPLPPGHRSSVQEVLTSGGRSLAQGALGWLWARSPAIIPVPGCRTAAEVEEAAAALHQGPLSASQVETITILSDLDWPAREPVPDRLA